MADEYAALEAHAVAFASGDRDRDRDRDSYRRPGGGDRDRDYRRREDDRDYRSRRRDDYDDRHRREDRRDDRGGDHYGGRRDDRGDYRDHRRREEDFGRGRRDDRGGGGRGGGRRDPGGFIGSPDRNSPIPDGTVPLSKRMRRVSGWDVKAPGYEQMSAAEAKQTGLFQLAGANRAIPGTQGVFPGQIQQQFGVSGQGVPPPIPGFAGSTGGQQMAGAGAFGPGSSSNAARQAKRLYVGNITMECNEWNIAELFNEKMTSIGYGQNELGLPVTGVQINHEKSYAFVEFRNAEETTMAMQFDNMIFMGNTLKLRRPKDYVGPDTSGQGAIHIPGVISTNVPDSPNKIFVGGLPSYLNDEQVIELLKSFGELKAFNLVKENGDPTKSKGFAFCEYVDPNITEIAIQGLSGMELGDRYLVVQRASVGASGNKAPLGGLATGSNGTPAFTVPDFNAGGPAAQSRVILMLNMVTPEELIPDEDYEDICLDIKEECEKYGSVEALRIPRPTKSGASGKWAPGEVVAEKNANAAKMDEEAGVGKVFVCFKDISGAVNAATALAGRQFGGRGIICAAFPEEEFFAAIEKDREPPAPVGAPPPPPPEDLYA